MNSTEAKNPLSTAPIGQLMLKYAIPSIISLVVNALYNIVDQIFIGWGVGTLGNSATNVLFPLNMILMAIALLLGDGGAALMSLELGRGDQKKAEKGANNTISWLIIAAIVFFAVCTVFLTPLVNLFGATPDNTVYAMEYGRILVWGFPFAIVGCGMCSLIRADGSPKLTMVAMIAGCVVNVILDALFVLGFHWGMAGAAFATVLGQIVNLAFSAWYIPRYKTVKISLAKMKPSFSMLKRIASLGVSSFISQIAVAVVLIVLNTNLVRYGASSAFGADIPLAAFGIAMKFNTIFVSIVTGVATGAQPIVGFNYGSGAYDRVKKTFYTAIKVATITGILFFIVFECFPKQLTALFGVQDALYVEFSVLSFRIFPMMCLVTGFQTVSAIFFQSIGKPILSGILSLSRQIVFLVPAVIILCRYMGVVGVLWAGPVADFLAFVLALAFIVSQMKTINQMSARKA
jgi:Na+-driven multidrug efflux pump